MPENMRGKEYYKPKDNKYESSIKAYWNNVKNKQLNLNFKFHFLSKKYVNIIVDKFTRF